jgi:hypothetical protein
MPRALILSVLKPSRQGVPCLFQQQDNRAPVTQKTVQNRTHSVLKTEIGQQACPISMVLCQKQPFTARAAAEIFTEASVRPVENRVASKKIAQAELFRAFCFKKRHSAIFQKGRFDRVFCSFMVSAITGSFIPSESLFPHVFCI